MQTAIRKVAGGKAPAELAAMRAELASKVEAHVHADGPISTAVPGLGLSRRSVPTECYSAAY